MRHRLMLGAAVLGLVGTVAGLGASAARQAEPSQGTTLVVAQDGRGQFRTIQAALDTISQDNQTLKTVLVRNGIYREKIFIKSSRVAIVGEDRDKTVIEYAELRKTWRLDHPDDWGAAVVNIGDAASDIFLGNLTVHNNYGSLHGDHDHQFAIRSGGIATRIIIVHAKIIADGGDTLSLWNTGNGMYYHADCDFEGWVDYVCPRGWCYITNSRFFGRNLTASIWHDGSKDQDQKLVIRRSSFDGVPGFPLGRTIDSRSTWRTARSTTRQPRPRINGPFATITGITSATAGTSRGSRTTWLAFPVRRARGISHRPGRFRGAGIRRRRCQRFCRSPRHRDRNTAIAMCRPRPTRYAGPPRERR